MRIMLTFLVVLAGTVCASSATAANLLINGDLDDPGTHESDISVGWTLDEYRQGGPDNTATFASFGNHTPNPNDPGVDPDLTRTGLWLRNFVGTATNLAFADLYQAVPGTAGTKYTLSAWARFEQFYAGGISNYPVFNPDLGEFTLVPSPTDTFLAIDFLDSSSAVISTSQVELKANGQTNNGAWKQHTVMGTAPAGTVSVRARGSAFQMVAVSGGQSAFFDDFVLEANAVPEPSTVALGAMALAGLFVAKRRR